MRGGRSGAFQDQEVLRRRVRFLVLAMSGLFCVLILRLFSLQVVEFREYSDFARKNHLQKDRVVAPRGVIFDRNGKVLADNVGAFEIALRSDSYDPDSESFRRLCTSLGLTLDEVGEKIEQHLLKYKGHDIPIVSNASKDQLSLVLESRDMFPPLAVNARSLRRYPQATSAAHLLGYVGEVNDQELEGEGVYYRGDVRGRSGVELVLEEIMRGDDGVIIVEVNAAGEKLSEWMELSRPPVPGFDAYLGLDLELQLLAENALAEHGAGSVVLMDVRTGEVLVAASHPSFDPGKFSAGLSTEEWNQLTQKPTHPLYNRYIQAMYPPGSTFKVITALAALDQGLIGLHTKLDPCYGSYRLGNRSFRCWKPGGHGSMNVVEAIVQSCDVFFYQIAEKIDLDLMADYARRFGLGRPTGLGIPGESAGLVPDRHFYDSHERFGPGKWTRGNILNLSIGQGEILVTVMQMARLMAAIGTSGRLVTPHFIHKVVDADGDLVPTPIDDAETIEGLNPKHLEAVRAALHLVTSGEHGTGRLSRIPGIELAGKTGTAQNPHGEDHAWFTGYAPADDPEISFAVIVENAGHGGSVAAPLAAELLQAYFRIDELASKEEVAE